MNYDKKLEIANSYLNKLIGLDWDDLPDTNSLHDCENKDEIIEACKERVAEEGFDFEEDEFITLLEENDDYDEDDDFSSLFEDDEDDDEELVMA